MRSREERRAALVRKFQEVGAERIARVSFAWVRLEQNPDDAETAAELLREVHTLKGEARTVGFSDVSTLAHRLETLLFKARDAHFRLSRSSSDAVLKAADALAHLLQRPESAPAYLAEELARLDAAIAAEGGGPPAPTGEPTAPPGAAVASAAATALRDAAAPLAAPGPAAAAARPTDTDRPRDTAVASVRVRMDRITSISDVAGEILVEHSKIVFAVAQLRRAVEELERSGEVARQTLKTISRHLEELDENVYRQGMHVKEMDRTARELRLVPLSGLLSPYARMVRDLAIEHGKEAALEIVGGQVEADKRVLELLDEPLLHVLRNCVDHGIEAPAERERAGKPRAGRITIEVSLSGGSLRLVVSDDGAGLDPAKIRAKAIQRGFLNEVSAQSLTPRQSLELLFLPGFSTRDEVTSLSGRGVGMDIVKRRVEQLGGRVAVDGAPGKGFRLELTVPVSISLTRALVLRVGEHSCAIPSASIESIRLLEPGSVLDTHHGPAVRLDGEVVPLSRFEELLTGGGDPNAQLPVCIVLRSGSERLALQVEHPGREADLVVKPLGPPLRSFQLVTGAAVVESGGLVLMLDVATLLGRARVRTAGSTQERGRPARAAAKILVVDDSVVLRNMLVSIIKGLGHTVAEASDGLEGLSMLETFAPDLIITDVQMPRMDGLSMLREIRADARRQKLPVVILSSLGSAEDRRRGAEAGADAYMIKNEFTEETVEQVLNRLLH